MSVFNLADYIKWERRIWSVIYSFSSETNSKQIIGSNDID